MPQNRLFAGRKPLPEAFAMQKVEGSSPFIRSRESPGDPGLFAFQGQQVSRLPARTRSRIGKSLMAPRPRGGEGVPGACDEEVGMSWLTTVRAICVLAA